MCPLLLRDPRMPLPKIPYVRTHPISSSHLITYFKPGKIPCRKSTLLAPDYSANLSRKSTLGLLIHLRTSFPCRWLFTRSLPHKCLCCIETNTSSKPSTLKYSHNLLKGPKIGFSRPVDTSSIKPEFPCPLKSLALCLFVIR